MSKDKAPICEVFNIHKDNVEKAKKEIINFKEICELSQIYKALGDPTRLRILLCLKRTEMCVCDICEALDMSQSAISHQLRILRNLRLVKYRKEGKQVFYSLDDSHIFEILEQGLAHVKHD